MNIANLRWCFASVFAALLFGCGGGSTETVEVAPPVSAKPQCETTDNEPDPNNPECGLLSVSFTDADGDFLSYSVDVTSLRLVRADGTKVEVLPTKTRVDFAQYVELSELVTAATIPNGRYVKGEITLNYAGADVQVEKDNAAQSATVVDANGSPLGQFNLAIQLDSRGIVVAPGTPAFIQIDFDLAASHQINLDASPITATARPILLGSVDLMDEREFRVRGPMLETKVAESYYRIALRPFRDASDRRGSARVYTNEDTHYLINGASFMGAEGLAAMAALPKATATVAFGTFVKADHKFTAAEVRVGDSVPGGTKDGLHGVVMARSGNVLTVKGVSLDRSASAAFRDTVTVTLSDATKVYKPRAGRTDQGLAAISVGQRIRALGSVTRDEASATQFNAEFVLLQLSSAAGHVQSQQVGELALDLQALTGHRAAAFDFSGTGIDSENDADISQYQVAIPNSFVRQYSVGAPVRVRGYVNAFGAAPADFNAVSVADYSDALAKLMVGFGENGSSTPFVSATEQGLSLDLADDALGQLHHLVQAGVRTDLLSLSASPMLTPPEDGRDMYALRTADGVEMFDNYTSFLAKLNSLLSEGKTVKGVFAQGGYRATTNTFVMRIVVMSL